MKNIVFAILASVFVTGCMLDDDFPALSVEESSITLTAGDTYQIKADGGSGRY